METMGENRGLGGGVTLMPSCEVPGGRLIGNPGRRAVDPSIFLPLVDHLRAHNNHL